VAISGEDIERRMSSFAALCRRQGLKATHQRMEIHRELAATLEHPDAETIYRRVRRRIPAISLDTVYRTLRLLEEKRMITRVGGVGERTRFDSNTERHPHFVCTECGTVSDVEGIEMGALADFPDALSSVGEADSVYLEWRGVCVRCRQDSGVAGA
jgi:Fur family transcriptional regulator, peroxide stress response regulator